MFDTLRGSLVLISLSLSLNAWSMPTTAVPEVSAVPAIPVAQIYSQHCASCHNVDRLGGTGPALLPENLERLRRPEALKVIADGRLATQMAGFKDKLSVAEMGALVEFIYTVPAQLPRLGLAEIQASRIVHQAVDTLPNRPIHQADPLNLFVVVESGDHQITLLDGDKLEPLYRFPTRFALHGGPKFSPDGRFVYLASRDGWISLFDLYNFKLVAEIRAGINTRNLAVSDDGNYVMVANYLPRTLVLLEAHTLQAIKLWEVDDRKGHTSRVSAVYTAPPRKSFIVSLKDLPEIWEIPYHPKATALPVYTGVMHDYRKESGESPLVDTEAFPVRRIYLDAVIDDFFFDQSYEHLIGAAREGEGQVVNLTVGRKIASIDLPGMPHLASGITWEYQGKPILATPNLKTAVVSVIDMQSWQTIKRIETLGPGFFMRSHEQSRYAWVDTFLGKEKNAIHLIDKSTLAIAQTLRPVAVGQTAAHVEFDRYGKYALVSIWEMEGAIVVYEVETLKEIKRLPMKKPSGKYNVYNKIHYVGGTSH